MPHYHTEGFENSWQIVRETPNSQKWRVTTTTGNNLQIDIHYTAEKILTANIVADSPFSKSMMTSVFNEIGRLGLYRGDYGVIDYTFSESSNTHDGNYGIDDKDREFRQL